MVNYVRKNEYEGNISVFFEVESDKVMAIGEKLGEICEDAYMNGYNWDALLNFYLATNAPEVMMSLDSDPEGGSYVAHFGDDEASADRLIEIITELVENEEELYELVRENAEDIEWD